MKNLKEGDVTVDQQMKLQLGTCASHEVAETEFLLCLITANYECASSLCP